MSYLSADVIKKEPPMTLHPVPSVRAIIVDDQDRVLLLRRKPISQGGGQWCLPGGKVDYGQRVADALRCEIAEETGLHSVSSTFLFYQDSLPPTPGGMHCINFIFRCEVAGEIVLNAESTDYAWVPSHLLCEYDIAFRNDEVLQQFFNDILPSE